MDIVEQLLGVALLGSAWVLYLLFALSVASIATIFERFLFFRKNTTGARGLRDALDHALDGNEVAGVEATLRKHDSVEADTLRAALYYRQGGPGAFLDALEAQLDRSRPKLDRGLNFLGTLGNNAPFIGLFGTVIGVIEAFQHLGLAGAGGEGMDKVMGGIAEALVATAVGIFVAIPAVVAYNASQKRVTEIEGRALSMGRLIAAWLRTSPNDTPSPARPTETDERVAEISVAGFSVEGAG